MGLQITKQVEKGRSIAFTHKLADIPNGGNIATVDLAGDRILEGSPVGRDTNGLFHVIKTAKVMQTAGATAKTYTVAKSHHFIVGDVVMLKSGGAAYAITAIATNSSNADYDDITVGTTLTAAAAGDVLIQAATAGADTGAFKYAPIGMVGSEIAKSVNTFVDIVTIGQIDHTRTNAAIGSVVSAALPLIKVI